MPGLVNIRYPVNHILVLIVVHKAIRKLLPNCYKTLTAQRTNRRILLDGLAQIVLRLKTQPIHNFYYPVNRQK